LKEGYMKKPEPVKRPRVAIHVDAVPEDEATQEELNRRLRKPGEPGYVPRELRKQAQPPSPGAKE
jgi:hypothetical protein